MSKCVKCKEGDMHKGNILCLECQREIADNPEVAKEWSVANKERKEFLKRAKRKLLKKVFPYQRKAFQYTQKVGEIFGIKVVTERIMGNFILDIYITKLRTAIEIDGGVHDARTGKDDERDEFFKDNKIKTIRFENHEVGTPYFKKCIWILFYEYYTEKHYNKILKRAEDNNIIFDKYFDLR